MRTRTGFGLAWSLVVGLVGGWLTLSPWSLAQQGSGDWTNVTRSEVVAGLGLAALAVLGLALVLADVVGWLREAGVLRPRERRRPAAAGAAASPELERALLEIARSLAQDMARQRAAGPVEPGQEQPNLSMWREQE